MTDGSVNTARRRCTLPKAERLHSKKLINSLFNGGNSKSMTVFPLRLIYMPAPEGPVSQMLISVPKRCFRRANKRNRVKRQVREAYRHNKLHEGTQPMVLAFIWLDSKLHDSADVSRAVVTLLTRLKERMEAGGNGQNSNAGTNNKEKTI